MGAEAGGHLRSYMHVLLRGVDYRLGVQAWMGRGKGQVSGRYIDADW